jgi:Tfp pilus assembly protein PilP
VSDVSYLTRVLVVAFGVLGMTGQTSSASQANLLDPTRPKGWRASVETQPQTEQQPVQALKLQGVFSVAGKRSAVISGQRVVVGDEVSGAEVLEIANNKVILQLDGETIELASMVPDVKSPAKFRGDRK